MLKKTITYEDYNGTTRTEDFYFNLTEAEILQYEKSYGGGLSAKLDRIVQSNDQASLIAEFKTIIDIAYGVKSDDGRLFIKNQKNLEEFQSNPAYSEIYMSLATNDEEAIKFVNGIIPAKAAARVKELEAAKAAKAKKLETETTDSSVE